ncbi:MAG: glutamate--tRNA ligase [Flammeovirgaceae bacterium]|nr:MAG: glutamate--tRNA ligase [Flammeovirgaceae bacterium]
MKKIRVRFAPSPTGALHIGGVRTALYNYLFARQQGGTMILRIEDTDQNRYVPGAEEYIIESLKWAGIGIDEGAGVGGPHAPYRQSERKELYRKYADQLIATGHAYYAFDSEAELEVMRERLKKSGVDHQQYSSFTRMTMRNSLTLPAAETEKLIQSGAPYVIRLKVPETGEIRLHDLIRGDVVVKASELDDKVLMKSDGMPTYHLANVVDDYLMKISHVIRGEEWLPSAPLHVLLYKSFGWEANMPQFAHLPLLLKPDGNGKLSKRDADRMGFPIFPLNWTDPNTGEKSIGFREAGYLPEALINFLAFLGWNPGTEQEIFSMEALINAFSIERIGRAGARFDIQKATWFNEQYIRAKPIAELTDYLNQQLALQGISCSPEKAAKIVTAMRDRVSFPKDFYEHGRFFFHAPATFDSAVIAKKWNADAARFFKAVIAALKILDQFNAETLKTTIEQVTTGLGIKAGQVMQILRVAITGDSSGPDLMMTLEIIGREETVNRLGFALSNFQVKAPAS